MAKRPTVAVLVVAVLVVALLVVAVLVGETTLPWGATARSTVRVVTFHSEGPPADGGAPLAHCADRVAASCRRHGLPLTRFTPTSMHMRGHADCVTPIAPEGVVRMNPGLPAVGNGAYKPRVLLLALEDARPNDIVVYRDANCDKYPGLAYFATVRVHAIRALRACGTDVYVGREATNRYLPLRHYAKGNVLREMAADDPFVRDWPICQCHTVVIRNTPAARTFLQEWDAACSNRTWIDGLEHGAPNPELRWSTPEQSLLNVLLALRVRDGRFPSYYPGGVQDRTHVVR